MTYSDFTLTSAESLLGLTVLPGALFPGRPPVEAPEWLLGQIQRGQRLPLTSEKARSEFLVAPMLLAARELTGDELAIYSGERLDVDAERGLIGACDFILALTPSVPRLKSPLVVIVEAKKHDIDLGLGQCVAQMVGALKFNEQHGGACHEIFGCVTTGQIWQFLRLQGATVEMDQQPFFIDNPGSILSVFQAIIESCMAKA